MRLLREVLPPARRRYPRTFDLLIVDEVHSCAPSGRGRYAIDSLRTKAIRTLAPHFEHRLFLSATPHNGYPETFTALLELLDDQRFARGVQPDRAQLERVMVRRLKSELPPRGTAAPGSPSADRPLEVPYTDEEREAHAGSALRRLPVGRRPREGAGQRVAADFVLTPAQEAALLLARRRSPPPSTSTCAP